MPPHHRLLLTSAFLASAAVVGLAAPGGGGGGAAAAACSVLDYGAACDGAADDAPHIQRALDDAARCGTVLVPAGHRCVSRALNVSAMSGRALLIQGDLVVWPVPRTYPTSAHTNMFISATDGDGSWTGRLLAGFTLAGGGRIVGGGSAWWPAAGDNRPRLVWVPNALDLVIANLTLVDSPAWNIGIRGDRMLVQGVRVESGMASCGGFGHAPNTDGVNMGGHGIVVRDLWVHNGDDCMPVTTGNDGTTTDVLLENVHCECGTNGAVIYNQGGSISGLVARNISVSGTNQGAGVKLSRPGKDATGGLVHNVTFGPDYVIDRPRYAALYVNVFQEDAQPPCTLPAKPDLPHWLTVTDLAFRGVSATVADGQAAGCFRCTPGSPCDATFDGVEVRQRGGAPAAGFVCLNMKGSAGSGGSVPAACKAAAAAPACAANVSQGVNCWQNDIQDGGVVESADACCALCAALDGCNAWTWDEHKSPTACWLKSSCAGARNDSTTVSGVMLPPPPPPPSGPCNATSGLNCWGNDLKDGGVVASADECCALCNATSGCMAWTWDQVSHRAKHHRWIIQWPPTHLHHLHHQLAPRMRP